VVDSEEAADTLRRAMADSDAIRASLGLGSIESRFVILPAGQEIGAMFHEEQAFRAFEGMPALEVYDLRQPAADPAPTADRDLPVEPYVPSSIGP
jgi:hypothetical protein